LHRRGLLHGNLHSNNVIVDPAGRPHLVDALEPPRLHDPETSAAPEQLLGHRASVRTDVHALGVIAFELLSGRHPYAGGAEIDALRRALYDAPPDLPHRCAPVVRRALAKRSWARPANGERFAGLLQKRVSRIVPPQVRYPRRGATFFAETAVWLAARLASIASDRARRLPARRRYLLPAAAIAAVLAATLGARFSRTHVLERRVEESLNSGQPEVAARLIAAEERRHGRSPTVDKLAGDVRCAEGEIDDCLRLYRRSLEKSSQYGSDDRVRRNVLQQIGREDRSGALISVLARLDGIEPGLVEDTRSDEYWRRWNAVRALEVRGERGRVDYLRVYTSDLLHAGSCSTRRAALAKIVALGGRGATESLRQASAQSEATSCLGDDLPRAIAALE
jgi:hypothetical protein